MRTHRLSELAVLAALVLTACGGAASDGSGGSASPTPEAPGYDTTAIADRVPVGDGLVIGATLAADGTSTLLVDGPLPGDGTGCEGMPLGGLQAQTSDGTLTPVTDAEGRDITSGVWLAVQPGVPGPGARVAVWSMCEKFTSRVLVGTIGDDGVPTDLVEVAGVDGEGMDAGGPGFETLHWASWTPDGARLSVIGSPYLGSEGGAVDTTLWEYDVAASIWTERTDAPAGIVVAATFADGSMLTIADDVIAVGGTSVPAEGARGASVGPDGASAAVYGPSGVRIIGTDGSVRAVADDDVAQLWWSADGSVIAFPSIPSGDAELVVTTVDVGSGTATVLGTTRWGWIALLPDGSGLGVTVPSDADLYLPAAQRWNFAAL